MTLSIGKLYTNITPMALSSIKSIDNSKSVRYYIEACMFVVAIDHFVSLRLLLNIKHKGDACFQNTL